MVRWLVGAAALVVAVSTHAVTAIALFFGTCKVSDTANRIPAPASAQGQLCRAVGHSDPGLYVVGAIFVASVLLAAATAVLAWRSSSRWRPAGLTACLWLPIVLWAGLSLPPDSCTDGQRRDNTAYACDRTGDG